MIPYYHSTPDRPADWSMEQAGYVRVTKLDYYGNPYEVWEQPRRTLRPGVNLGASFEKIIREPTTHYEAWQSEKYGNILVSSGGEGVPGSGRDRWEADVFKREEGL